MRSRGLRLRQELRLGNSETSSRDIERLILEDPAEFERLLHSYILLLGERKIWWERVAESESDDWQHCVHIAIRQVAYQCGLSPQMLAKWLEVAELPKARRRVLNLARQLLQGRASLGPWTKIGR